VPAAFRKLDTVTVLAGPLLPAPHVGDGGPAIRARLDRPAGVTVDSASNLLIADSYNNRIRVVADTTGTYYGQR
jgi:hypothetical protein